MTFNISFFLPALALLWVPLPYVARKDRAYTYRGRITTSTITGLWRAWQNWVDLFRSAGGAYVLTNMSISIGADGRDAGLRTLVVEGVLLVGLLMQVIRFTPGQGFLAPLFYLTGLTAVLQPPNIAGFGILLGWAFGCGLRDPRYVLPSMAVAMMIAAYFLGGLGRMLFLNVGLIVLPIFLALLCQRRLLFVSREPVFVPLPKEPVKRVAPVLPKEPAPERVVEVKGRKTTAGKR